MSFTYTNKNSSFARLQTNIPNLFFPNRVPIELSQIAFPTIVLLQGDRTNSFREDRLGLPYWTMILVHVCFGRRFQISGLSHFGIFNNVGASSILTWLLTDTAYAACPAHPGSLEIMSMTFAAVICDADVPCSVHTAYAPESSFTMSPRNTPLH